jgi:elongation factor 1-beta
LIVIAHLCIFLLLLCQFDVTTEKGLAAFNGFMGSKSYVEGYSMSAADTNEFAKFQGNVPDPVKLPHAYRWYVHIAALTGGARGLSYAGPPVAAVSAEPSPAPAAPAPKTTDDDDFDVFGDDDEEAKEDEPKESRAEMLARLKKEAEDRTIAKEAKQRTIVAVEIKPWDVEQDLMALFKKITETITQDGMKWAENCNLADVAFGIKKIQTTFTMGANK